MENKCVFHDCDGQPVYEFDIYYIVTEQNKILPFIADKTTYVNDDVICFSNFSDARELTIKFKIEECASRLSAFINQILFSHASGLPMYITLLIQKIKTLSSRIRNNGIKAISIEIL